jgi:hypothetical protein
MTAAMTSRSSWQTCPPRFGTPRRPERATLGPQVGTVARRLGMELMPWQQHVADVAFEIDRATGRFAYREVVLTVPRRSGKSALLLAVLIHRMVAMKSPQVAAFTMQNGLQARMRLRREWKPLLEKSPALRGSFEPSMFSGAEALIFNNGSRLEVSAGTSSSGHGATLDLAVVDEAFDQPDDRLEQAFRPAIRTQPDAQLWWVSTAGAPTDLWFRGKVEAARAGKGSPTGTALFEWSAPDDADASDPAVWWDCMPALGFVRGNGSGLTERDIAEEYEAMTRDGKEDGFRRAYLNQWVNHGASGAFDLAQWNNLIDTEPEKGSPVFGVATAADRSRAAIVAAWRRPDGLVQLLLGDDYRDEATWVESRVDELRARYGGLVFVDIPSRGLVGGATKLSPAEQALAQNALADMVTAGTVRHGNEKPLTDAVRSSSWRDMGDTRVLDRKGSADILPLLAAALAVWGLKRNSGRSIYEDRGMELV